MILAEFGTGQVLWSMIWLFLFIIWFWLLIAIFSDLFRDRDLSGWAKAAWTLFVVALPYLGILVYLIARGHGMTERTLKLQKEQQAQFDEYVRQAAGGNARTQTPAEQILTAKELLDQGAISQAEFDRLKKAALG